MGKVHPIVSSRSRRSAGQSIVAVVCAYACLPGATGEPGRPWRQAVELAQAGFDVWIVTSSDHRLCIEAAMQAADLEGVQVLFWDAPSALRPLERWQPSARLLGLIWYWIVGRAIDDWQASVGMYVLRRIVHPSRASVTYLVLPSVRRSNRPSFLWHAQSD